MLFLDEVTEFRRDAIEGLRQPLEDGRVVVARAMGAVEFPARFALVAASDARMLLLTSVLQHSDAQLVCFYFDDPGVRHAATALLEPLRSVAPPDTLEH